MTKEEFKKLFDEHFNQVRNYMFYRSGNTELATDIAQETFLKIWEKQNKIDDARVKGLLFKIANNLFVSYYRKEKRSFEFFKHYEPDENTRNPEEDLVFKQLKENYSYALQRMPEKQRAVFLMSRVDQLTYNEIAEMVGVSVKAVEKRMRLALHFLRTSLKTNE
ncbi:RNA polymerase sigma factor [Draconibacterium halophilum]|uniref:Sigma-70 family RNA polymerase sigma factor n=1 Tax=Draconibacterium halophilum TaxID=2706887 RepID=A0A6C0RHS1_9BACT|nr:sigma-70 family RNA polymerase sigma factor [Draconibacterium halophilum]QIA09205.1 sigma-70 family RNA polymerase sigma factor [Draconibacterium halophilum]